MGSADKSIIGRELCPDCHRRSQSLAAGAMAGGATGTSPVGAGLATAGWRERVRRAVGRKSQD